jgi:hypothetical protein
MARGGKEKGKGRKEEKGGRMKKEGKKGNGIED